MVYSDKYQTVPPGRVIRQEATSESA
jgi:hypothetical protein